MLDSVTDGQGAQHAKKIKLLNLLHFSAAIVICWSTDNSLEL